jgi:hypothetical protein
MGTVSYFPGGSRVPGHEAGRSASCNADSRNEWSHTSTLALYRYSAHRHSLASYHRCNVLATFQRLTALLTYRQQFKECKYRHELRLLFLGSDNARTHAHTLPSVNIPLPLRSFRTHSSNTTETRGIANKSHNAY